MELEADYPSFLWQIGTLFGCISPAHAFHIWVIMFTYLGLVGAWVHYKNRAVDQADSDGDNQKEADGEEASCELPSSADADEACHPDVEPAICNEVPCSDKETQTDRVADRRRPRATATCEESRSCETAHQIADCQQSTNSGSGTEVQEDQNGCGVLLEQGLDVTCNEQSAVLYGNSKNFSKSEFKYRDIDVDKSWEVAEKEIEIGFVSENIFEAENILETENDLPPKEGSIDFANEIFDNETLIENYPVGEMGHIDEEMGHITDIVPTILITSDDAPDLSSEGSYNVEEYDGENFEWSNKDVGVPMDISLEPSLESCDLESTVEVEIVVPVECGGPGLADFGVQDFDDELGVEFESTREKDAVGYGDLGVKLVDDSEGINGGLVNDMPDSNGMHFENEGLNLGCPVDPRPTDLAKFNEVGHDVSAMGYGNRDSVVGTCIGDVSNGAVYPELNEVFTVKEGISELVNSIEAYEESEINSCENADRIAPAAAEKQTHFVADNRICKQSHHFAEQDYKVNARELLKWPVVEREASGDESESSSCRMYLDDDDISVGYSETRGNFKEIVDEMSECQSVSTDVNSEFPDGYSDIGDEEVYASSVSSGDSINSCPMNASSWKAPVMQREMTESKSGSGDSQNELANECSGGWRPDAVTEANITIDSLRGISDMACGVGSNDNVVLSSRDDITTEPSVDMENDIYNKSQDFAEREAEDSDGLSYNECSGSWRPDADPEVSITIDSLRGISDMACGVGSNDNVVLSSRDDITTEPSVDMENDIYNESQDFAEREAEDSDDRSYNDCSGSWRPDAVTEANITIDSLRGISDMACGVGSNDNVVLSSRDDITTEPSVDMGSDIYSKSQDFAEREAEDSDGLSYNEDALLDSASGYQRDLADRPRPDHDGRSDNEACGAEENNQLFDEFGSNGFDVDIPTTTIGALINEVFNDEPKEENFMCEAQEAPDDSGDCNPSAKYPNDSGSETPGSVGGQSEVYEDEEDPECIVDVCLRENEDCHQGRFDEEVGNSSSIGEEVQLELSESSGSCEDIRYEPLVYSETEEFSPMQHIFEADEDIDVIEDDNCEPKEDCEEMGLERRESGSALELKAVLSDEEYLPACLAVALPNTAGGIEAISESVSLGANSRSEDFLRLNWRDVALALSSFPEGLTFLSYFRKTLLNPAGFIDVFNNNPLEFHCLGDNISKRAQICVERLKLRADFQTSAIEESRCEAKKSSKLFEEIELTSSDSTKDCELGPGLIKLPGCFGSCYREKAEECVKDAVASSSVCKPQITEDGVEIVNNANENRSLDEPSLPAINAESLKEFHSQHRIKTKPKYAQESARDFAFLASLAAVDQKDFTGSSTSLESAEDFFVSEADKFRESENLNQNHGSPALLTDEKPHWRNLKRTSSEDLDTGVAPKRDRSYAEPVSQTCLYVPFDGKYKYYGSEFFQGILNSRGLIETGLHQNTEILKSSLESDLFISEDPETSVENSETADFCESSFKSVPDVASDFDVESIEREMGQGQSVALTKGTLAMPVSNYLLKGITVRNHGEYTVIHYKNTKLSPIVTVDRKIKISLNVPRSSEDTQNANESKLGVADFELKNGMKEASPKRPSDVMGEQILEELINEPNGDADDESRIPKLSTLIKNQFEFYVKTNHLEMVADHVDSIPTDSIEGVAVNVEAKNDVNDAACGAFLEPVPNDSLQIEHGEVDVVLEPVAAELLNAEVNLSSPHIEWDGKENSGEDTVEEHNKTASNVVGDVSDESRASLNETDNCDINNDVRGESSFECNNICLDDENTTSLVEETNSSPEIWIDAYDTGNECENNTVLIEDVDTKLLLAETKPEDCVAVKLRSRSLSSLPEGPSEQMAWFYRNRPSSVCLEEGPSKYSDYGKLRRAKSAEISRRRPKIVIATNLDRKSIKETNLDELMKSLEFLGPRSMSEKSDTKGVSKSSSRPDVAIKERIDTHVGRIGARGRGGNASDIRKAKSTTALTPSKHEDKNASIATLIERFERAASEPRKLVIETKTVYKQSSHVRNSRTRDIAGNLRNSQDQNKADGLVDDNNNKGKIEDQKTMTRSSKSIVRPSSLAADQIVTRPCTTNAVESGTMDRDLGRNERTKRDLNASDNAEVGKTMELGIINTTKCSDGNNPSISHVWRDSVTDSHIKQNGIPGRVGQAKDQALDLQVNGVLEGGLALTSENIIETVCEPEISSSQEPEVKRTSIYGLTVVLSENLDYNQAELEVDSKNKVNRAKRNSEEHFWLEQRDSAGSEANGRSPAKVSDIDLVLNTPLKDSCESLDSLLHDGGNAVCVFCGRELGRQCTTEKCAFSAENLQRQRSQEQAESKLPRSRNSFRKDRRLRKWLEERQSSLQSEDRASLDDMDAEDQTRLLRKIARSKGLDIGGSEDHDIRNKRYSSLQSRHVDFLTQLRYLINFEDDDYDDYVKNLTVTDKEQDAIEILKEYEMSRQLKRGKSPLTSDDEGNDSDAFTDITDASLSEYTRSRYSLNSLHFSHGSLHQSKSIEAEEEHQGDVYNHEQEDSERPRASPESQDQSDTISKRQEDYETLLRAVNGHNTLPMGSSADGTVSHAENHVVEEENKAQAVVDLELSVVASEEEKISREIFLSEDVDSLISMANSAVRNRRNRVQRNSVPKSVIRSEPGEEKPRARSTGSLLNKSASEVFVPSDQQSLKMTQEGWVARSADGISWPNALDVYVDSPWSLSMERLRDSSYGNLRAKLKGVASPQTPTATSTPQQKPTSHRDTRPSKLSTDFTSLPSPVIRKLKTSPQQRRRTLSLRDLTPKSKSEASPSAQKFQSMVTPPPRCVRESPFRKSTGSYDQKKKAHRSLPDLMNQPAPAGPSSPVRLSKFPSGGSSTFSLTKPSPRSPRSPRSPATFRSPRSGSRQSSNSSFRSPVRSPLRSPLRSPRLSEVDDDVADCETVYSDFTACFSDSSMDVGIALDGYELEDEDFFLANSAGAGHFSPSFDDFLMHENDDASSGEYFVPLHTESKRPQGRLINCAFGPCKNTDYAEWAQSSEFTSCVSCFTYYCSKECRKADWKEHKLTCYYGRINYYTKALVRRFETNSDINKRLSITALKGFEEFGRGCVHITFSSPMAAKFFLVSGTQAFVKEPIYAPLSDISNEGVVTKHQVLLQQTLIDYDPEFEFVVNLTVFVGKQNQAVLSPRSRFKTSALLRCTKIPLNGSYINSASEPSPDASYEIKVFYLPRSRSHHFVNETEARRYYCREVSYGLRKYGIHLKHEFADVYDKLCLYVEHNVEFVPITLYGQANGKNYKCVIFPEGFSNSDAGSVELQGRGMLV